MQQRNWLSHVLVLALVVVWLLPGSVSAAVGTPTQELREHVTLANVRAHQAALQAIADANGGTRAATTPGYDASVAYVVGQLEPLGYIVTVQEFDYIAFRELSPAELEQISPNPTTYIYAVDFFTMDYSASGEVTAPLQAVDLVLPPGGADNTSSSGCETSDFASFTSGNIALIQRGTCNFSVKAENAEAAGAVGVIIFNEGQPGRQELFGGTLGGPVVNIPVLSATFDLGNALASLLNSGPVTMRIRTETESVPSTSTNVIADTPTGRDDRVLVVGAHLDSVPAGPGINDNGSGTAAILEIAVQMANLGIQPRNKVRFAFWGAEEAGLVGAEQYVSQLNKKQIQDIQANLNFDMIGSPNFVRFVYDGDGSGTELAGPNGSGSIESVFLDYFAEQGLATEPTAFDGRSDYGPFIAVGIPAGGLFTGAEGIKTAEQAAIYGGTAGMAYDPCYHQACDTYANNSDTALDQMTDATAHAVLTFAMTTSAVNGTDKGKGSPKWADGMTYKASHLKK
jgi:Zn-dependent M28 family amino/carboxypeptidase